MRTRDVHWALAAVAIAGCYNPTFRPGAPCTSDEECPSIYRCIANVCGGTEQPDLLDAASEEHDALVADASIPIDSMPDVPLMLTTHVIGDDRDEIRDAYLWGSDPNINYGDLDHYGIDDGENGIVWFDLSSIPAGKTVMEATLRLSVWDEASESGGTVTIHRVREPWTESQTTWLARASGQSWMRSGARPPDSSDSTPVASITPATVNTSYTTPLPASLVQEWLDNPGINYGLLIQRGTATEHVHIRSRDNGFGWPRLTITVY